MSRALADLVRRGLGAEPSQYQLRRDEDTGLLTIRFGRTVTTEDVRSLDDDE